MIEIESKDNETIEDLEEEEEGFENE